MTWKNNQYSHLKPSFRFSKYLTSQNHQNRHLCVPLCVHISWASVWQAFFPLPIWKCFIKVSIILKDRKAGGWSWRREVSLLRDTPSAAPFPPPDGRKQDITKRPSDTGRKRTRLSSMGRTDEASERGDSPRGPDLHGWGTAERSERWRRDASRARRGSTLRLRRSAHSQRGPDPGRRAVASAARPPLGKKPVAGGVRKKGREPNTEVVAAPAEQVEAVSAMSATRTRHRRMGACRPAVAS